MSNTKTLMFFSAFVVPVDSLWICIGLKGRRVSLLVLEFLILPIIYCTSLSKAAFDFSKAREMSNNQEYHLASQELRI